MKEVEIITSVHQTHLGERGEWEKEGEENGQRDVVYRTGWREQTGKNCTHNTLVLMKVYEDIGLLIPLLHEISVEINNPNLF